MQFDLSDTKKLLDVSFVQVNSLTYGVKPTFEIQPVVVSFQIQL